MFKTTIENTKNKLLIFTFSISLLFGAGSTFNLFKKFIWYDELTHLIAGVWVGFIFIYIVLRFSFLKKIKAIFDKKPFLSIIVFSLLVGITWEIFEFGLNYYLLNAFKYESGLQPSMVDTLSDLIMDVIGSLLALISFKKPPPERG